MGTSTVEKALYILESFLGEESQIGIVQLAKKTGLNVSTAYRMAAQLAARGYLQQKEKRAPYSLGLKLLEFSNAIRRMLGSREVAMPFLTQLGNQIEESINLAIPDADEAIYVEHIAGRHHLRTFTNVGNRVPLYCTGVGKVFLASRADAELERYLVGHRLKKYTSKTLSTSSLITRELIIVREQGYALDNEEFDPGIRCIAVPIQNDAGKVVASVSVSGPATRLTATRIEQLADVLKRCGSEISSALGFRSQYKKGRPRAGQH